MKLSLRLVISLAGLIDLANAATITATWSYDFTNMVICSTTVTTNCFDHFELGFIPANGGFQSSVSIPAPTSPTGQVTGISGVLTTNLFGTQQISVIAVAKDGAGARITSNPLQAQLSLILSPPAPSDFNGIAKP